MKLYFAPGACSLSPHVALRESGLPFSLERVDLRAKKTETGADYLTVSPKGYVPTLVLEDGTVLTEGALMVQWIADQVPDRKLAPPLGTLERYRFQELMHFIATELHKGMSPLYNVKANDEFKQSLKERLGLRWGVLAKTLEGRPYAFGDAFTVADPYVFYVLRAWQKSAKESLAAWPVLADYYARLAARPTVKASLEAEAIEP